MSATVLSCRARRGKLSACIASFFAFAAPVAAIADTWTVTVCIDDPLVGDTVTKTGSLRYALNHAISPATISLAGLTGVNSCDYGKIVLDGAQGQVTTALEDVTLAGPGLQNLTIDASYLSDGGLGDYRAIRSTGSKLTISGLTISGGLVKHDSLASSGGCIYTSGDLTLDASVVTDCRTDSSGMSGYAPTGGAIYALGNVTITGSTVSNSEANANGADAVGGGIAVRGNLTLETSSIQYNSATSVTGDTRGGNVFAYGTTTITASTLAHGTSQSTSGNAVGGAFYAASTSTIVQSIVTSNTASAAGGGNSGGGGIYAHGDLELNQVMLDDNVVNSSLGTSRGGGAQVRGTFLAQYSSLSGNDSLHGSGGALEARGDLTTIKRSTISGNTAVSFGGLAVVAYGRAGSVFELSNSTVSGNSSMFSAGALYADSESVRFYNTTIAFNQASPGFRPGVVLAPGSQGMALALQSTLIASNSDGVLDVDLFVTEPAKLVVNGGNAGAPANSLIRLPAGNVVEKLPGDTKMATVTDDACPHLQALRGNGGLTATHRPMSDSPAIDTGNNVKSYTADQRGKLATNGNRTYLRVSGAPDNINPQADIGAHEVEQDDIVFGTDFEGCNALP